MYIYMCAYMGHLGPSYPKRDHILTHTNLRMRHRDVDGFRAQLDALDCRETLSFLLHKPPSRLYLARVAANIVLFRAGGAFK